MTKQFERIIDAITGEVTERELTQAEIDANANSAPYGEQSTPFVTPAE
jgi:hypothetical protein